MAHVINSVGQERVMVLAVQPVLQQDETELPMWLALHRHMQKVAAGREDDSSDDEGQSPRQGRGRPREVPQKQMPFGAQAVLVRMMRSLRVYTDTDEETLQLLSKVVQVNVDGCSTMSGKFSGFGEWVKRFVPDVVVTVDFFHNIETAWRHVRRDVPELRQFLDDLNYVAWIWRRSKTVVTRVTDLGGTRSISQGCATRQIKPTLVVLEQVGVLYGHLHKVFMQELGDIRAKEKRAKDRMTAKQQKEEDARRRREARTAGDQAVTSDLPRVPRHGDKRALTQSAGPCAEVSQSKKQKASTSVSQPQPAPEVRPNGQKKRQKVQTTSTEVSAPQPAVGAVASDAGPSAQAIPAAEPENDPEPEGYRSEVHKKNNS